MKYRLDKRLAELWGDSSIYYTICSERFGNTMSDIFFYECRQIAQRVSIAYLHHTEHGTKSYQEDMVYNSLLAFSAADAAINTDWSSGKEFSEQSYKYYGQAALELRRRIGEIDQRRAQGRNPNTVPILYTVFLLAAFGVSI
jgi:hypothetical protein